MFLEGKKRATDFARDPLPQQYLLKGVVQRILRGVNTKLK
jgi:hypothetical protein